MLTEIKLFYNENKMWMQLLKYIFLSVLLALLIILIDTKTIVGLDYIPKIFLTSVDLAKEILSTLTGSLLTITTFTFSTIMVVLTMYSSDFSPRVVNNFLTDNITLRVLGVFIGGFVYCILTLFFMKNTYSEYLVLSATIAVIYSFFCIIYFVMFVFYVSSSIQASKLINRLYYESSEIIDKSLRKRETDAHLDHYNVDIYDKKVDILALENGYLDYIGFENMLKSLNSLDSKLILKVEIGDFISKGQKIAELYYDGELEVEKIKKGLLECLIIEDERLTENDYRFSLEKIVDITLRALSPGINDPNTAIHCINILGVLLAKLSQIEGNYRLIEDKDSKALIIYEDFNFKENIYFTFYQIAHYGKEDMSVILAIFDALRTIKASASEDKYPIVDEFKEYVYHNSLGVFTHKLDMEVLELKKWSI